MNEDLYVLMNKIGKKDFKIAASTHNLSEVQTLHNELLLKYDPDQLAISKVLPVTVRVVYREVDNNIVSEIEIQVS